MLNAFSPVISQPRFGALIMDPSVINNSGWAATPDQAALAERTFNEKNDLSPVYVLEKLGYDVLVKSATVEGSKGPRNDGSMIEFHAIAVNDPEKKSVYASSTYAPYAWQNNINNIQKFWADLDRFGFRFLASLMPKKL